MTATLEERVTKLERDVLELADALGVDDDRLDDLRDDAQERDAT